MSSNRTLMVLPGDGVGPEVVNETLRVVEWLAKNKSITFNVKEGLVGGASYDKYGTPLTDETLADTIEADAVLFGAVGGPKYDGVDFDKRPENGLLRLRKEMDLFANLRPAMVFPALVDASSLKPDIISGLDILILRELTGGIYFAEPRGIEEVSTKVKKGYDTNLYTTPEIERIGRVAFDLAKARSGKVTSVEKANVMMSGVLWREVMTNLHINEGNGIDMHHMYADNCAMQLLRNPKQFDVIVTDNLFGDILSDEAAMLTGSLGLLPSASLGAKDKNGKIRSMYEPVHGSAPDIAGKNIANPLATILSAAMMFEDAFSLKKEAQLIREIVNKSLKEMIVTEDLANGEKSYSTSEVGDWLVNQI